LLPAVTQAEGRPGAIETRRDNRLPKLSGKHGRLARHQQFHRKPMKKTFLASLAFCAATAAFAAEPNHAPVPKTLCASCGTVEAVHVETRKGEGGAVGIIGGALVGGLIGHQIGGGTGKTLATVGGAAAGGYAGNEVQKHVNSRKVWVTTVRMRDGSIRRFEQGSKPGWSHGSVVKAVGKGLQRA
jgi:outer membrane lipoprotein SlyB